MEGEEERKIFALTEEGGSWEQAVGKGPGPQIVVVKG